MAIEENSELDLFEAYQKHAGDPRIASVMADMQAELGGENPYAAVLPRLAQYELTLLDWVEGHKGAAPHAVMAHKCWPAFQLSLIHILEGSAHFTVDVEKDFEEAVIRPLSKGVKLARQGRRLSFTLTEPGGYTLELDGPHHALHILADPPEQDAVRPEDPDVIYFGPGVHECGVITLTSNQTLYLDEGAVLYATVEAKDADNVRIIGRGNLDNSRNKEEILFQVEPVPAEGESSSGVVEDGDDICMGKVGSFDAVSYTHLPIAATICLVYFISVA